MTPAKSHYQQALSLLAPHMFPELFTAQVLNAMRLLHYLATLGGGLFLIVHVYLGTVAYPGTARGMIDGKVTPEWARLHHTRWTGERAQR